MISDNDTFSFTQLSEPGSPTYRYLALARCAGAVYKNSMTRHLKQILWIVLGTGTVIALGGCSSTPGEGRGLAAPRAEGRSAPLMHFAGANSPSPEKPGDTDCNSPAHWDGNTFYIFNSSGHPWRSAGHDLFSLTNDYRRGVEYCTPVIISSLRAFAPTNTPMRRRCS